MPGTKLPTVRIPQGTPGQDGDERDSGQDSVISEHAPSNRFGFAWPAEQPVTIPIPLATERAPTLSSSDGETDVSEEEHSVPLRRHPRPEGFTDGSEFTTPTNNSNLEQNPLDNGGLVPPLPRLSRAFSMPLPSQLGSLQHPRRPMTSSTTHTPLEQETFAEVDHLQELSLELADSVQMVIQTLLQLSPPQVLDPAKEQFSACSLSIPTPSISAMFTSMKNLNYMSANMTAFSSDSESSSSSASSSPSISVVQNSFDIGEMLQSVGDALSGVSAQAGVELVLFHGDVGMKHISVKGDESGLSYTLSHVRS
jgi:osomolarity two-component system, response regulator SSK1